MATLLFIALIIVGIYSIDNLTNGETIHGILLMIVFVILFDISTVLDCNNEITILNIQYDKILNNTCPVANKSNNKVTESFKEN